MWSRATKTKSRQILTDAGVVVLDGDAHEVHGIGFAGVKGFGGGFGRRALGPWGETIIKQFVHEAVSEALKLEAALARLRTSQRSRCCTTRPFSRRSKASRSRSIRSSDRAGSKSRSDRIRCRSSFTATRTAASRRARTKTGVPVYNVSMPLLARAFPDAPPFRVFDVVVPDTADAATVSRETTPPVAV